MWNRCFNFMSTHAYFIGGAVVVGTITLLTGSFTMSVVGFSASYGLFSAMEKLIK